MCVDGVATEQATLTTPTLSTVGGGGRYHSHAVQGSPTKRTRCDRGATHPVVHAPTWTAPPHALLPPPRPPGNTETRTPACLAPYVRQQTRTGGAEASRLLPGPAAAAERPPPPTGPHSACFSPPLSPALPPAAQERATSPTRLSLGVYVCVGGGLPRRGAVVARGAWGWRIALGCLYEGKRAGAGRSD